MDRFIITSSSKQSLLSTHRVLCNTYFLLSLTLLFSALTATISTILDLPSPGLFLTLSCFYGLLFLTHKLANRTSGIFATFALTGFMGYSLGPVFNIIISSGSSDIIMLSLIGTALVFLICSVYVLISKKDMSFLSGMIMSGSIVLLIATVANLFFNIPAMSLAISVMFILFSSSTILWEISNIIHEGERNYIRATVSLYVSIYNIFVSLLNIFIGMKNNYKQ